jgi:hypothetical protein
MLTLGDSHIPIREFLNLLLRASKPLQLEHSPVEIMLLVDAIKLRFPNIALDGPHTFH